MIHATLIATARGYVQQSWRDLLSVYYANTPIWRWLKSGALLFLGIGVWAGGSAVHSVTGWRPVLYLMAYGFLLIVWGPFTHMVLVPLTIRLRRNAETTVGRAFSRNSGKINLTIFAVCIIALATFAPGVMMLEFSPSTGGDSGPAVGGELVCEDGDSITCEIVDPQGVDHVVVLADDQTLERVEGPPFRFSVAREDLTETRSGRQFIVEFRDADGNRLQRLVQQVGDP
ncbi:hypothetical protein SAMN05216226_107118 [Halovenus aranensis]|uniref:Uncharacterized protein n=1 Tax=Halovenus aranensis TaxID=890420 RepID=A0A1G8VRH5_9EURY|nr:hypothetical protein [Halovenus aranensis]SDJ68681.1 hypothetical protein SAMN05216226_107118 [Halovenus aranensis]